MSLSVLIIDWRTAKGRALPLIKRAATGHQQSSISHAKQILLP
jgi:hypothetical protein